MQQPHRGRATGAEAASSSRAAAGAPFSSADSRASVRLLEGCLGCCSACLLLLLLIPLPQLQLAVLLLVFRAPAQQHLLGVAPLQRVASLHGAAPHHAPPLRHALQAWFGCRHR